MISPCCGSSLQQGAKFLAMFSMVLSVAGVAFASFFLVTVLLAPKSGDKVKQGQAAPAPPGEYEENIDDPTTLMIKLFVMLIGFIFNLFLAILLFIGAEQKNLRLCKVWFKVTLFLFLLDLIFFGGSIVLEKAGIEDYVINSSSIIYSLYEMWVVLAFTDEIKSQKEAISGCTTAASTTV